MSGERSWTWAANWYMTRRHIDVGGHGLCSEYTKTWPDGYVSGTFVIPPSDSDEVKALRACRLCERKAKSAAANGPTP